MKAKFILMLLSVLFIIPINAATEKKKKRKSSMRNIILRKEHTCRSLIEFNMSVKDVDDNLIIHLQSSLSDATITVIDNNGYTIIYEPQTFIYEGMMLNIYTPKAYPYTVEITSPTLDITGEIVLEEY